MKELDRQAGVVLDALDAAGLADRTLVIFTTDHGVALARHKHTLYDGGLRTALLLRLPGVIPGGSTYGQLLSNVDLFPTVCELTGVPVPDDLDGASFAGLFRGEDAAVRRSVFASVNWSRRSGQLCYTPHRCLRTDRYKLIRNDTPEPFYLDGGFVGRHVPDLGVLSDWPLFGNPSLQYELYDCVADAWEQHNLSDDPVHADRLGRIKEALAGMMRETGDPLAHGTVPNQTGEPVKPQWLSNEAGEYRLNYDLETETKERPFAIRRVSSPGKEMR